MTQSGEKNNIDAGEDPKKEKEQGNAQGKAREKAADAGQGDDPKKPGDTDNRVDSKKTSTFVQGKIDPHGRVIAEIYGSAKEWVVYRSEGNKVRIHIADDHLPETERVHLQRADETAAERARIDGLRPEALKRTNLSVLGQIARGNIQSLQGNPERSRQMLAEAELRLRRIRTIEGRFYYQIAGSLLVLLLVAFVVGIELIWSPANTDGAWELFRVITCGSIGGLLSVSLGITKLEIDPFADQRVNATAGLSRIVIAMLGAVFLYFAMKAEFAFSSLLEASPYALWALAYVAGFSETLVPQIIQNVDSSAGEASKGSDSEGPAQEPARKKTNKKKTNKKKKKKKTKKKK